MEKVPTMQQLIHAQINKPDVLLESIKLVVAGKNAITGYGKDFLLKQLEKDEHSNRSKEFLAA